MIRKSLFVAGGFAAALVAVSVASTLGARAAGELEPVVTQRVEANDDGAQSQVRVDKLSDETDLLATEYRAVLKQTDALLIYNRQITGLVESQDREMASLRGQIDDVELVAREIIPLMLETISSLETFVELDVPFLQKERAARIADLHDLMQRSDVTDAERFRRILESYQIENEYGRTIEAYSGELEVDGKNRIVDFLRVGRTVLIYQTRDGSEAGVWDQDARAWKPVPGDYKSAIRQGLMIARKQAAPDMLRLPVQAAKVAR
jgi:hypothetical protein